MQERNTKLNNFRLFDELDEDCGSITSRKFFSKICEHTIKYLKKYFKHVGKKIEFGEHGFALHEQQIKSYITPAINKITDSAFMQEYPINRKRKVKGKEKSSAGRLDYWANFGNCSFLIELKHGYIGYFPERTSRLFTIHKNRMKRLSDAETQIKRIEHKSYYKYKKNLYSFEFAVFTVYVSSSKKPKPLRDTDVLKDTIKRAMKPNILGIWKLTKKYLYKDEDLNEYYPALCFIGKIEKLIG